MSDAYTQALEGAVLFDLSSRGVIELAGKDARLFLHNLCTNDVKELLVGGGCEAFLCTVKARVIAHAVVGYFQADDQDVVRLDVEPGMATAVLKHLDHYLISERVELADRTNELAMLRVCGPNAGEMLSQFTGDLIQALPAWHHVARKIGSLTAPVQVRRQACLAIPGYDLIAAKADVGHLQDALTALGTLVAGPETHEVLRVEAGWPVYGVDMDENRFVVEVGRTQQAISYTKGCYLGQEPIVMARDRGHVNRTLMGLRVRAPAPLPAGTKLLRDGKEVGQTTSSVLSPRFGTIALAYIRRGNQEPGTVLDFDAAGTTGTAEVTSLPFWR